MLVLSVTAGLEINAAEIDTTLFVSGQILSCPTDSSIIVRIVPLSNMKIYYRYGTESGVYTNITSEVQAAANNPVRTDINNLMPETRYYYRLYYMLTGSAQWIGGDEATFTTQRLAGSAFRFTIRGDSHLYDKKGNPVLMRITMDNINKDKPDFDLEMGDTFGDDRRPENITQQDMMKLHLNYLKYLGLTAHSAPFFFCIGNHEGESGFWLLQNPPGNLAVWGTLARKYYYTFPSPSSFYSGNISTEGFGIGRPENYYSWEWGDALFVVLDGYRYSTADTMAGSWDWTIGTQQYEWLKERLETSTAKFKLVFIHQLLGYGRGGIVNATKFEWGGYGNNGSWAFTSNRPGWAMPIHQLLKANGVNILFHGHDHLFAKEVLDGIVYQEVPMPSDSTYSLGMIANGDAYTGDKLDGSGHLRVNVSPDEVKVEYVTAVLPHDTGAVRQNGKVVYSYSVSPSTKVNEADHTSEGTVLKQNYPNPFYARSEISYVLQEGGYVSLSVYDVLGNEVTRQAEGYKEPGTHTVEFKAGGLAAGIYLYQLNINNKSITRKAIVLK